LNYLIVIIISIFTFGCSSTPYKVSKKVIQDNITSIAVINFYSPNPLHYRRTELTSIITPKVVNTLKSKGYKVIGTEITEPIFEQVNQDLGGYTDSTSGVFDQEKYNKVLLETYARIQRDYGANGFISQEISIRVINFNHNIAMWDGVRENVLLREPNIVEQVLTSMFVNQHGTINGLSYCSELVDINNQQLYIDCGGLELITKIKVESLDDGNSKRLVHNNVKKVPKTKSSFVAIPVPETLNDHRKITDAVEISLDKLVGVK
jgi:hypothetical protein